MTVSGDVGWRTQAEKRDCAVAWADRCQNGRGVHRAGGDVKLRPAAKCSGKQLRLHAVGIGDENTHGIRSGGGRTHHSWFFPEQTTSVAIVGTGEDAPQGHSSQNMHTTLKSGIGISGRRGVPGTSPKCANVGIASSGVNTLGEMCEGQYSPAARFSQPGIFCCREEFNPAYL